MCEGKETHCVNIEHQECMLFPLIIMYTFMLFPNKLMISECVSINQWLDLEWRKKMAKRSVWSFEAHTLHLPVIAKNKTFFEKKQEKPF